MKLQLTKYRPSTTEALLIILLASMLVHLKQSQQTHTSAVPTDIRTEFGLTSRVNKGSAVFIVDSGNVADNGLKKVKVSTQTDAYKALATGLSPIQNVSVTLNSPKYLQLTVTNDADGSSYDHADWADAQITCADGRHYLSDLAGLIVPSSVQNGWGPYELDTSNGENLRGDGHELSIRGQRFAKGLGVHAKSNLLFNLSSLKNCTQFQASVGIDDEVAGYVSDTALVTSTPLDGSANLGAPFDGNSGWLRSDGSTLNAGTLTPGLRLRRAVDQNGVAVEELGYRRSFAWVTDSGIKFTAKLPGVTGNTYQVVIVNSSSVASTVASALAHVTSAASVSSSALQITCDQEVLTIKNPSFSRADVVAKIQTLPDCPINAAATKEGESGFSYSPSAKTLTLSGGIDDSSYDNLGFVAAANMPVRAVTADMITANPLLKPNTSYAFNALLNLQKENSDRQNSNPIFAQVFSQPTAVGSVAAIANVSVIAGDPYFVNSKYQFQIFTNKPTDGSLLLMQPLYLDGSGVRADFAQAFQRGTLRGTLVSAASKADYQVLSRYCAVSSNKLQIVDCSVGTPSACSKLSSGLYDCSNAATHFQGVAVGPVTGLFKIQSGPLANNNKISEVAAHLSCPGALQTLMPDNTCQSFAHLQITSQPADGGSVSCSYGSDPTVVSPCSTLDLPIGTIVTATPTSATGFGKLAPQTISLNADSTLNVLNFNFGATCDVGYVSAPGNECILQPKPGNSVDLSNFLSDAAHGGANNVLTSPTAKLTLDRDYDVSDAPASSAGLFQLLSGNIDGAGHTITTNQPLFYQSKALGGVPVVVKNLNIVANIVATNAMAINYGYYYGPLFAYTNASIDNVHISGTVNADTDYVYVGGVVGFLSYPGSITNSSTNMTLIGGTAVGGLVGGDYEGLISASSSSGTVQATVDWAGGLVGYMNDYSSVLNSYSTATVSTAGSVAGGIVAAAGLAGEGSGLSGVNAVIYNVIYNGTSVTALGSPSTVGAILGRRMLEASGTLEGAVSTYNAVPLVGSTLVNPGDVGNYQAGSADVASLGTQNGTFAEQSYLYQNVYTNNAQSWLNFDPAVWQFDLQQTAVPNLFPAK